MKIVILTCDEYAWIVPVFLHFLKKYWSDNPYEIEIITEKAHVDGTVFYTRGVSWSSGLINYLKQSKEKKFLLILEDCLIDKKVDTERVQMAEKLCRGDVGCINLNAPERYQRDHTIKSGVEGFREYPLDAKYSMAIQPAIWQKQYLLDILRTGESCWGTEIKGSRRLKELKGKWRLLWAKTPIMSYHPGSLIHKGKFHFESAKWAMLELLNNNNLAFIDVGELGWSLYLAAHIRWLKKYTDSIIAVITLPDRKCLYEGIADDVIEVPDKFRKKYDLYRQDSFKLRHLDWEQLRGFFLPYIPAGYRVAKHEEYPTQIFSNNRIYEPYKYSKPRENGKEIIIFPRCRPGLWQRRNLQEKFYTRLIKRLCDEFPKFIVRTIGTKDGAYDMTIKRPNYINWVGKDETIQNLIDKCQSAVAAVGSQSSPPKLTLLQGVPTFIIGHQKERHIKEENWMNTKVGFYEIDKRAYETFNDRACINAIIDFVREVK